MGLRASTSRPARSNMNRSQSTANCDPILGAIWPCTSLLFTERFAGTIPNVESMFITELGRW